MAGSQGAAAVPAGPAALRRHLRPWPAKFLQPAALVNTRKALEAVQAQQKRAGTRFAVRTTPCGCSDEGCGAFHVIDPTRTLPAPDEADATLRRRKSAQGKAGRPAG